MTIMLILGFLLTAFIHCAETLSYSIRLAGVQTGKLAVALSLTGIILLVSRTANMALTPMLAGIVDLADKGVDVEVARAFHWVIAASTVGTLAGMVLFPSFVRIFSRMVMHLETAGTLPRMLGGVTIDKLRNAKSHIRRPRLSMLRGLRYHGIPNRLLLMNVLVTGIYTVGVLSAMYAGYLFPERGTTATTSSGLINGIATILLTVFIDPHLALATDRSLHDGESAGKLGRIFGMFMITRAAGTLLAQLLLVPGAYWIGWMSDLWL